MKTAKIINILIADDDPFVRAVWEVFSTPNYSIKFAANGNQVLATDLKNIDLIFMDINMPKLNGIEATKAIRSREGYGQEIPIIAVTAHARKELLQECIEAGIDEVLKKPLFPHELDTAISRWLDL